MPSTLTTRTSDCHLTDPNRNAIVPPLTGPYSCHPSRSSHVGALPRVVLGLDATHSSWATSAPRFLATRPGTDGRYDGSANLLRSLAADGTLRQARAQAGHDIQGRSEDESDDDYQTAGEGSEHDAEAMDNDTEDMDLDRAEEEEKEEEEFEQDA